MTRGLFKRPSDPSGAGPDADTAAEESLESKPEERVLDPTVQLQADLISARGEAEEWQDRFLRKAAEFENYRKRVEREKKESLALAKSSVLAEFLPLVDGYERALGSFAGAQEQVESLEQFREGVRLLYKQLIDTLARVGVVPIQALGEAFDPHLHEALGRVESADHEENTVVEELRRGYMYKDRLLRPAQVKVSIPPVKNTENSSEPAEE